MNSTLKRWIIISMLTAGAICLSIIDSLIPIPIYGVKLGLANVIILIMIYEFKWWEAGLTNIFRIFIAALIRGTLLSPIFMMSLFGGILSYIIMLLLSKIKVISPIVNSSIGAIFHATGQILAVMIFIGPEAIVYLPYILLLSFGTGILSGVVVRIYLKRSITGNYIQIKKYNS